MLFFGEKEGCLKIKILPPMSSSHQLLCLVKSVGRIGEQCRSGFCGANLSKHHLFEGSYIRLWRIFANLTAGCLLKCTRERNRAHRSWSDLSKLSELSHNTRALRAFCTQLAGHE